MTTHRGTRDPLTKFEQVERRESFNTEYDTLMGESHCTNPFPYTVQVFSKLRNEIVEDEEWAELAEITHDKRSRGCLDKEDVVKSRGRRSLQK